MKMPSWLLRLWGKPEEPDPIAPEISALRPALIQRQQRERVLTAELRRIEKVLEMRGE
jgi:hypothetical protein